MGEKLLLKNIGTVYSGRIEKPVLDADSILVVDGIIAEIGKGLTADEAVVYDVNGMTVTPGLIDSHVHIGISEWGPRQSTMDWIGAYAAAGITGIISAGETHVPNRPKDAMGVKALAILTKKIFDQYHPNGAKIYGGAIIPVVGLTEQDVKDLHDIGIFHTGEFGLGNAVDPDTAGPIAEWGRKYGVRTMCHTGATFLAGSTGMDTERILGIKPDVICHVSGGGIPVEGIQRFVDELPNSALEVCAVNKPGPRFSQALIRLLKNRNQLHRLIIGTDSPSGYGIFPHGVWEVMAMLCGLCELEPEYAICAGSGNTANCYGLFSNKIQVGYAADINVCDAPLGCEYDTVYECLRSGTVPAVALVFVDGKITVSGETVGTAPAKRIATRV